LTAIDGRRVRGGVLATRQERTAGVRAADEQLRDNLAAASLTLSADERAALD
jgi:aryl-alcohol dehydrogenase-like predicted oxidoreductase